MGYSQSKEKPPCQETAESTVTVSRERQQVVSGGLEKEDCRSVFSNSKEKLSDSVNLDHYASSQSDITSSTISQKNSGKFQQPVCSCSDTLEGAGSHDESVHTSTTNSSSSTCNDHTSVEIQCSIKTVNIITESDIPILLEQLANHATKWREIGILLGFSFSELDVIASKPKLFVNAPNSWLAEMFHMWVQWSPQTQHGKHATLYDLVKALNSKLVGLAAVAEDIKKAMKEWNEQDKCQIAQQEDSTVAVLKLKPPEPSASALEHYAYYLRSYFACIRVHTGKWPEIEAKEYIRLAIVSNNHDDHTLKQFREETIHGSINESQYKAMIELRDLLKPNIVMGKECPVRRLLLEGAPGIGKSTLSWEICRKWGSGELFQEYSLVIMLRFRDLWVQNIKSLSDLFRFPGEPKMQKKVAKQVKLNQGKGVLFILEGFDEAPPSLRRKDFLFVELFEGLLLPNATVMVTSRPNTTVTMQSYSNSGIQLYYRLDMLHYDRRVEVVGFGKKEINEYIEAHFGQSALEIGDFHQYLELYPYIYSIMYIPLNSTIVTHMYQMCKSTSTLVPQTMTQLYTALIKTLLLCYLKEREEYEDAQINCFNDLPQPVLAKFHQVCKLAYDGVTNGKQIIFSGLSKDFDSLGLMKSVSEVYIDKGTSDSHSFLHFTIQEFLAAHHLSMLSEQEQLTELEGLIQQNVPPILKFLAGLCEKSLESSVSKVLAESKRYKSFCKKNLESERYNWSISLAELHLCFEIHDPSALSEILGFCEEISFSANNTYHLRKLESIYINRIIHIPNPPQVSVFDYYILGYCIIFSSSKWRVRLEGKKEFELFLQGISMHHQNKFRNLSILESTFVNCNQLAKCIHLFPNLEQAHFTSWDDKIDSKYSTHSDKIVSGKTYCRISELAKHFPTNSLTSLSLPTLRDLTEEDCTALSYFLASSQLKKLMINADSYEKTHCSKWQIHDQVKIEPKFAEPTAVYQIFDGICRNTLSSLQELHMRHSTIDPLCIDSLVKLLKTNTSITTLDISCCEQTNRMSDIENLAKSLLSNSTLKFLDISSNCKQHMYITQQAVSKAVFQKTGPPQSQGALSKLKKSLTSGPSTAAIQLRQMLMSNQVLVDLKLVCCPLHSQDIVFLADGLKLNSTLETLDLRYNTASDEGATAIADALENNTVLKSLDIQSNDIGDKGTIALAKMLKNNTTLQTLNLRGIYVQDKEAIITLANVLDNSKWNSAYELKPSYRMHNQTLQISAGNDVGDNHREHGFRGGYIVHEKWYSFLESTVKCLLTVNNAELLLEHNIVEKLVSQKPRPIYYVRRTSDIERTRSETYMLDLYD